MPIWFRVHFLNILFYTSASFCLRHCCLNIPGELAYLHAIYERVYEPYLHLICMETIPLLFYWDHNQKFYIPFPYSSLPEGQAWDHTPTLLSPPRPQSPRPAFFPFPLSLQFNSQLYAIKSKSLPPSPHYFCPFSLRFFTHTHTQLSTSPCLPLVTPPLLFLLNRLPFLALLNPFLPSTLHWSPHILSCCLYPPLASLPFP
jgi:hypothetical protein